MAFSPETYAILAGKGGGGGGGGSLPTPTAADVGSALTVQKVPVQGATIVPEQTITLDEEFTAVLTPVEDYQTMFINGADVFAVVDGISYYSRVVENLFLEFGNGRFQIYVYNGDLLFYDDDGEATTVACYVAGYAYEYVLDPYPGYDAVFQIDFAEYTGEVIKGNYADIRAKLEAGDPVFFGVFSSGSNTNAAYVSTWDLEQESIIILVGIDSGWSWYSDGRFVTND